MKRLMMLCAAPLALLLLIGLVPAISQEKGEEAPAEDGDGIEAWKKLQQPGDAHNLLGKLVGDWDMHFKMWMEPGVDPTVMEMSTTFEPRFGGRFVVGEYEMTEGPFPHKGETWFGHDNAKGKYQWIRVTDMDTSMRIYEGTYDEKTKAITTRSEYSMEWQGQTFEVKERNVWTFHSDDKIVMEVYTVYAGMPDMPAESIKEVEITYTRAKAKPPATLDPNGILKKLQGDFTADMKIWMGPGEPVAMTVPLAYNWTLDGQAIVMEYDASDMEMMPHKGIEYITYNEGTGQYDSMRLTSMSGAMIVWSGKYDPATKTLEFKADVSGEANGEKYSGKSRALYKWESDDKYTATVYTKYDGMGEEIKEVEMVFTRAKK